MLFEFNVSEVLDTMCTGTNKDVWIALFRTISRKPSGQDEAVTIRITQDEDARIVVPCYITNRLEAIICFFLPKQLNMHTLFMP